MLRTAVETQHHCRAVHLESVPITERADGQIVWAGTVEVFGLSGLGNVSRCYAWVNVANQSQHQFITVLQKGFVRSPQMAVKAWIATKHVTIDPLSEYLRAASPSQVPFNRAAEAQELR